MRVLLGGQGLPREEFALAGIGESGDAPVILLLEDGETFTPADYISLGYTNYEVWCVGASGGQGGGVGVTATFDKVQERQVMPSDIWAIYVSEYSAHDGNSYPMLVSGYGWSDPNRVVVNNGEEYLNWYNPTHEFNVYVASNPRLISGDIAGGGAGGGGVHVVSGALADLDATLEVVVGIAGDSAELGHTRDNNPWTPMPWEVSSGIIDWVLQMATGSNKLALNQFFYQYPGAHKTFYPPQAGEDGVASSFGDICKASGGKGGHPAKAWSGSAFVIDGDGGDGGAGDRDISGGGGLGSLTPGNRGLDGAWDPDTGIGKGGGGGHGGSQGVSSGTIGGKGAFSYGDTSIYGKPQSPIGTVPGNGGGVRALRNYPRGARAPTYDPNGAVLIRLSKND